MSNQNPRQPRRHDGGNRRELDSRHEHRELNRSRFISERPQEDLSLNSSRMDFTHPDRFDNISESRHVSESRARALALEAELSADAAASMSPLTRQQSNPFVSDSPRVETNRRGAPSRSPAAPWSHGSINRRGALTNPSQAAHPAGATASGGPQQELLGRPDQAGRRRALSPLSLRPAELPRPLSASPGRFQAPDSISAVLHGQDLQPTFGAREFSLSLHYRIENLSEQENESLIESQHSPIGAGIIEHSVSEQQSGHQQRPMSPRAQFSDGTPQNSNRVAAFGTPVQHPGLVTPPSRPVDPPSAPSRPAHRDAQFARTPAPPRLGILERDPAAARTAPPVQGVSYPPSFLDRGELRQSSHRAANALRGSVDPQRSTAVDLVFPSVRRSLNFNPGVGERSSQRQRSMRPNATSTPEEVIRPVGTEPRPLSEDWGFQGSVRSPMPPELQGMRTGNDISQMLRQVALASQPGTVPKSSKVLRSGSPEYQSDFAESPRTVDESRSVSRMMHRAQGVSGDGLSKGKDLGDSVIKSVDGKDVHANEPASGKEASNNGDLAEKRHRTLDEINQHHAESMIGRGAGSGDVHMAYTIRPDPSLGPNVQAGPATFNYRAGALAVAPPHGFTIHDTVAVTCYRTAPEVTVGDVIASAEAVRDAIKRIENSMRSYRASLKVDVRELRRTELADPAHGSDQGAVKGELMQHQLHHATYLSSLYDDLNRKEYVYRRNLERLNRQADDPVLDPLAGIPENREERTEEEQIIYRARILTRAKLEKLGYKGGPVEPFLKLLSEEVWRSELREVILASDHRVSEAAKALGMDQGSSGGSDGKPGWDTALTNVDITDLTALPFFKVASPRKEAPRDTKITDGDKLGASTGHRFSEENGPGMKYIREALERAYPRTPSPVSTSESEEEEEEEERALEQSIITDAGMSEHLKSDLMRSLGRGGRGRRNLGGGLR
ncbi:hypothetical protein AA313_de0201433 [Arthrobotrys entomopaga]|nr:hypothetical protein AA313_de0201433 [Arthrobotrys entomopaga]